MKKNEEEQGKKGEAAEPASSQREFLHLYLEDWDFSSSVVGKEEEEERRHGASSLLCDENDASQDEEFFSRFDSAFLQLSLEEWEIFLSGVDTEEERRRLLHGPALPSAEAVDLSDYAEDGYVGDGEMDVVGDGEMDGSPFFSDGSLPLGRKCSSRQKNTSRAHTRVTLHVSKTRVLCSKKQTARRRSVEAQSSSSRLPRSAH